MRSLKVAASIVMVLSATSAVSADQLPVPVAAHAENTSNPDVVIGNGTPESCTSAAVVTAVAHGGIITFNCGPNPLTITMSETAKIRNWANGVYGTPNRKTVIDGGGRITLSGGNARRILYMNACDESLGWTTSHCQDQDHPYLVLQNLSFINGFVEGDLPSVHGGGVLGGGAVFVRGGQLKVVNSTFTNNSCDATGPDVGGGAIRMVLTGTHAPSYIVNSRFEGNHCSNGGAVSGLWASYSVINSTFINNWTTGWGANPQRTGTPGGGNGGALYGDGNAFHFDILGSRFENNTANEGGGAIFFVSNNRTGTLTISDSIFFNNPSKGFSTSGYPPFYYLGSGPIRDTRNVIGSFPAVGDICPPGRDCTVPAFQDSAGRFHLWDTISFPWTENAFYYGNPGDVTFSGDWDCDGVDTLGLYRRSDGFAYLRNANSQGTTDITFFFGNPGDYPIAGDFNGNGCDTLSIYRPSEARFYVINKLGTNGGGLGAADFSFLFGNLGDKPFVGDFNGNGIDSIGLHRESTGLVYFRNSLTTGVADSQFIYGNPGDMLVAGDWDGDGDDTVAVYRPSNGMFYVKFNNTQGNADATVFAGKIYTGVVAINR